MDSSYKFDRSTGYPPHVEDWSLIDSQLSQRGRFLEVGVAEGRSVVTTAELLFSPSTEMYCVDSWERPEEGEMNFDHNLSILQQKYSNKITKKKIKSIDAFIEFMHTNTKFDFIYIDSEKSGKSVIQDFVLSFHLLNVDGILMFDDYYAEREQDPIENSKMALNMVMFQYQKYITVLRKGKRCIIKKRKHELRQVKYEQSH